MVYERTLAGCRKVEQDLKPVELTVGVVRLSRATRDLRKHDRGEVVDLRKPSHQGYSASAAPGSPSGDPHRISFWASVTLKLGPFWPI